ncbi:MAG: copper homeostasis protein CutC [Flavobacteriaceae bacterium]
MIVEVCANSLESALIAEQAGADRLEVCAELGIGGITPSYGVLLKIKEMLSIPAHVLIRPRSGDFSYSDIEFDVMLSDIDRCVDMGFEGIVSGVLHRDFTLDIERTAALVERSAGLQFTFHRAFDWVADPLRTLAELEAIGVNNILSSGQAKNAVEGLELLEKLLQGAANSTIIPAAGIRSDSALKLKKLGFSAIHLSGVNQYPTLLSPPKVPMITKSLLAEDRIAVTELEIIEEVIKELNKD